MEEKIEEQPVVTSQKKKWYRTKWFYGAVGAVVVLFILGQVFGGDKGPTYEFTAVQKGDLSQTVDATGNVESADEIDLRFEMIGRVAKIYKQANDEVKTGDIIAELDLQELNGRVAQYSASVARAQANLNKVLAGETDAYLSNIKAKLDQAQANLDQMKATSADTVANAQAALDTAENNLKLSEGGDDSQIVQDAYQDMVALLQSIQNTLSNALTEADNILGIDNTLANDEFEDVLSALSSTAFTNANSSYRRAKSVKSGADIAINNINTASSHEDIDWAADTAEEALSEMKSMLFDVSAVLDATVPIGELSQSELTTLKTNINTDRAAVSTDYTSLINQEQAVSTAKNSYTTYYVAYKQAQTNLENAQAKATADVAAYQALLDQAQASYDDAKNPARDEDIATARAQLNEAYAGLTQAVAARNKGRIIAPIEGVIGKIDAKIGEYVSSQDDVVKIVSPHFEVQVDIPETDIIKITKDDDADITLDAYGEDVHFMGKVTEIEIGETVIQDVIYYQVTVSLNDSDEEHQILNGMTSNILFYTEDKSDVLYIPQRVVRTDDEGRHVLILNEAGEEERVAVETGLRGDGGLIEIVSGLTEGQEVIVKKIENE